MELSLYERLGGSDGITKIASDTVDLHLKNAAIAPRFSQERHSKFKKRCG